MTNTDRKIMMLKKMTHRLKEKNKIIEKDVLVAQATIAEYKNRVQRLMARIKGNGGKAPVPAEMESAYKDALKWVETNKWYPDGAVISVFKNAEAMTKPTAQLTGEPVIDFKVVDYGDGVYDLEFAREWLYNTPTA